jgi:hypothetical protein
MTDRSDEFARRLAFWAVVADDEQNQCADKFVSQFTAESADLIAELQKTEQEVAKLDERKCELAKQVVGSYYRCLEQAEKELTEKVVAAEHDVTERPLTDLIFWSRLSSLNTELYSFLQPRWDELEARVAKKKIQERIKERGRRLVEPRQEDGVDKTGRKEKQHGQEKEGGEASRGSEKTEETSSRSGR